MTPEELSKTFSLEQLEAALEIKEAQNGSRTTEENLQEM